jgi:tetratricopeptide (TPR) repeat protein
LRIIREDAPPPPSAHLRTLGGELDWITLHCLEKDRERRYAGPAALADDVRRYLRGEPVAAGPVSRWYLFRKFVARNRAASIAAAIALVAVLAGAGVSGWQAVRATRAEARAQHELHQANQLTDITREINAVFAGMLRSANRGEAGGRGDITVREMLDLTAERLDRQELTKNPAVEAEVRSNVGQTYEALGLYEQAERHLRAAYELRDKPDVDASERTLRMRNLASVLLVTGRFDEGVALLRRAMALYEEMSPRPELEIANVKADIGQVLKLEGKLDEAGAMLREALAAIKAAPNRSERDIAVAQSNYAQLLAAQGRSDEAERLLLDALRMQREFRTGDHQDIAIVLAHLAVLADARADAEATVQRVTESYQMCRRLLGDDHPNTVHMREVATTLLAKHGRMLDPAGGAATNPSADPP